MDVYKWIKQEIFGMAGLRRGVEALFRALGVDVGSVWGGALVFFVYDVIKILIMLSVLIYFMSLLQSFFPPERTRKICGKMQGFPARVLAALLGVVTPFCSCSSIPIFIGFVGAGLPLGVTFTFLIASPLVDLASLVVLAGAFGWKMALVYVLFGMAIAIMVGSLIEHLHMEDELEPFVKEARAPLEGGAMQGFKARSAYAAGEVRRTVQRVYPWILLGVGIGAVIHNWIPRSFVERILGDENPFGVVLAVLVGVPMYSDIFGTIPIAEALLAKGALPGVVLAFMMATTCLSLPSLVMLRRAVKPKLLSFFVASATLSMVLAGYVFNGLAPLMH